MDREILAKSQVSRFTCKDMEDAGVWNMKECCPTCHTGGICQGGKGLRMLALRPGLEGDICCRVGTPTQEQCDTLILYLVAGGKAEAYKYRRYNDAREQTKKRLEELRLRREGDRREQERDLREKRLVEWLTTHIFAYPRTYRKEVVGILIAYAEKYGWPAKLDYMLRQEGLLPKDNDDDEYDPEDDDDGC